MPSTVDMKAVVRHNLVQDPALYALIEGRVYPSHGREAEESTRSYSTVILDIRGGRDAKQSAEGFRTMHLYAYSVHSSDEAGRVYELAKAVLLLKGLKGRLDDNGVPCETVCIYSQEQSAPIEGYNDQVAAWFVRGTWTVWGMG